MKTTRNITTLNVRDTHTYVGTHSHLDRWTRIGTMSRLSSRMTEEPTDFDDGGRFRYRLRVDATPGATDAQIKQALRDEHTSSGCSHTYDCCGCASTYVTSVRKAKRREWIVETSVGYNY